MQSNFKNVTIVKMKNPVLTLGFLKIEPENSFLGNFL